MKNKLILVMAFLVLASPAFAIKPGADVSLQGGELFRVKPNVPTRIDLKFDTAYRDGEVSIHFAPDEDVTILGQTDYSFTFDGKKALQLPIEVIAPEDGGGISVDIEYKSPTGAVTPRMVYIKLETSTETKLKKPNASSKKLGGKNFSILPANEEIK